MNTIVMGDVFLVNASQNYKQRLNEAIVHISNAIFFHSLVNETSFNQNYSHKKL